MQSTPTPVHKLTHTAASALRTKSRNPTNTHKCTRRPHTHKLWTNVTHIPKHTRRANLADSSAALIADLNRPGDLSLSLTHTQHTSFFSSFFSLPFLLCLSSFFLAQISLALSQCHFTSAHSGPSPRFTLPEMSLSYFYHRYRCQHMVHVYSGFVGSAHCI